ncbi:hypothetical protein CSA17_00530 [bacterium DOLJORAL78_65_58]|nr:MAG: hypothetical protein CSA17_00530 [bacterium DOLJORAL78_65_58]
MRYFIVIAVLLATVFCGLGALAGEEVVRDGVLHVVNGATPRDGVQTLDFEEVWRAGGEDGEDFFGLISKVLIDDDGTIYLLDTRLSEVPVYSPEGERLGTLSREGDGPGETRMPTNMVFMPDGNLGLVQSYPGKIVKIDRQGVPAGDFEPKLPDAGFMMLLDGFTNRQGLLTLVGMNVKQESQTKGDNITFVSSFGDDGQEKVRFVEQHNVVDYQKFRFDEDQQDEVKYRQAAVGADGRVYVTLVRNAYEIRVFKPDGGLERIIQREYTPRINSLRMGQDGNLWVTTSRSGIDQPDGVLAAFDVFSPDGHFLRQVRFRFPGNGEEDAVFFAPNGDAVVVTGFTAALESLMDMNKASDDSEEAAPMEVIYLKAVH